MALAIPTIHSNGTRKAELLRQYTDAAEALRLAVIALEGTMPNGRDYIPTQGDDAMRDALRQHQSRWERLEAVRGELLGIAGRVNDGGRRAFRE